MLKRFCIATIVFAVTVMVTTSGFSTIIVGAKGGYFIWRPFLKDISAPGMKGVKDGTGALAGPVFSLSFTDDLSLSVSGLFGAQDARWDKDMVDGTDLVHRSYSFHEKRYDIDSAINYTITPNFKIFAGYKYQFVDVNKFKEFSLWYNTTQINSAGISSMRWKSHAHGPALGIGLSYPFNETYFITSNFSVIYFFNSNYDTKSNYKEISMGSITTGSDSEKLEFLQWGVNVEPAIGAKISESIIGTVGVRFQWLSMEMKDDKPKMDVEKGDRFNDYLYGIFVSVMYVY